MIILKQSHSAEKLEGERPFGVFETLVRCKISKNLKGDPFVTKNSAKKVA